MQLAILALEVDGSDETPIGVFRDVAAARDAILAEAEDRWGAYPEQKEVLWPDERAAFLENLAEVQGEWDGVPTGEAGVQFESGMGSYDFRFQTVKVWL